MFGSDGPEGSDGPKGSDGPEVPSAFYPFPIKRPSKTIQLETVLNMTCVQKNWKFRILNFPFIARHFSIFFRKIINVKLKNRLPPKIMRKIGGIGGNTQNSRFLCNKLEENC